MGYKRMQNLTHDMENVFSEVRNGTIKVQPEMIDILFNCLDALEEYLANIQQTTEEGTNDNAELIKSLNDMLNKEEKEAKAEKEAPVAATAPAAESTSGNEKEKWREIKLNDTERMLVDKAHGEKLNVFGITVYVDESCVLKAARAFLVFKALEKLGEVIVSVPTAQDIEDEKFDLTFSLIFISGNTKDEVIAAIKSVSEIAEVYCEEYQMTAAPEEKAKEEAAQEPAPAQPEEKQEQPAATTTAPATTTQAKPATAQPAAPAKQEAAAPAPAAKAEAPAAAPAAKAEGKSEFAENDAYVHATPLIRRLAREFGVNLAKVKGTGRKGRILREDVQAYVKEAIKRAEAAPAVTGGGIPGMLPWPKVDFSKFGEIEEVELGRIQKISGANLSRNWVMIPHVTHFDKTDITELEAFRKQQNEEAAKRKLDVKITPVVFIMKAVAAALEQMPRFNSSLSEDGQRLTLKKYINIGVAVDTPNGLVVPVFKDVNKKGIIELSRELMTISKKARDGKLTAGEMQGGCFTISSIGGLGTTHFAPIVNAPEVAILGVSKSAMEPVWNGKEFVPRLMLPISLSFDHRVIDGADGARFITIINNTLSDIRRLVM